MLEREMIRIAEQTLIISVKTKILGLLARGGSCWQLNELDEYINELDEKSKERYERELVKS